MNSDDAEGCANYVPSNISASGSSAATTETEPPFVPGASPELVRQSIERYVRDSEAPDSIGTGPYPSIKHEIASLPNHVIYQPADLSALGDLKMPIYVFGNGACSEDGASQRHHLLEIASHGYLVIASGRIYSGSGKKLSASDWLQHRDKTSYSLLGEAIEWAIAENSRAGSPFEGRIAVAHIAASGYSCGGRQALRYAGDRRVGTFVIMNTGLTEPNSDRTGEMAVPPQNLDLIQVPTLYVVGGPEDIAYHKGKADFARLTRVPSAVISIDVGHRGTFSQANGGPVAQAVVAWLEWQFRGDTKSAGWFSGPRCQLCVDPAWEIERRNL